MSKVQLALTDQETAILSSYGSKFGYNLAKTIRFIISKTTESLLQQGTIPVYKMSEKREKIALKALQDYKTGKTKEIKNIDAYLNQLAQ